MWTILKTVPVRIAVLFALAGFISAYICSAYSAWVKNLYAANNQQARVAKCVQVCDANRDPGVDCTSTCEVSAHKEWYEENVALTKYADRQWWIWGLTFPVSMVLAVFVSMSLGWLPRMDSSRVIVGAILLFGASLVVVLVMMTLQYFGFFVASVAYAYLLARTSAVTAGKGTDTRDGQWLTFGLFLLCIPAGMILGELLGLALPSFSWFAGIEVAWALAFGAALVSVAAKTYRVKRSS